MEVDIESSEKMIVVVTMAPLPTVSPLSSLKNNGLGFSPVGIGADEGFKSESSCWVSDEN